MAPAGRRVALVLGGARSGKSRFAERLAAECGPPVLFIATATPGDAEMRLRIERHRAARPPGWRTAERPLQVARAVTEGPAPRTVLLDCLTLLVSNCLAGLDHAPPGPAPDPEAVEAQVEQELEALLEATAAIPAHLIVVSNEVGLGLVPPYPLGRTYRDVLGLANQRLASAASEVYLLVAGIPLAVKGG